eukprot:14449312-Alexandrium_andersonii.AAC.1
MPAGQASAAPTPSQRRAGAAADAAGQCWVAGIDAAWQQQAPTQQPLCKPDHGWESGLAGATRYPWELAPGLVCTIEEESMI